MKMHRIDDTDREFDTNSKCNYRRWIKIIVTVLLILLILAFIGAFVVVPLVFKYSFDFQQSLMFTRFGLPRDQKDFQLNLDGVNNLYVIVNDSETSKFLSLGVWHMLPWSIVNSTSNEPEYFDLLKNSNYSVLLHFHGTGETRRDSYKMSYLLRNFFQVILFDYRGYGDSDDGLMTEKAVVNDCVQLYKWLQTKTDANIYIWGHSLGASLALNTIKLLETEGIKPHGIFLEAAFTSMWEEIPHHPYGKIFAWLPYFDGTIRYPLLDNGFYFDNEDYILRSNRPLMVFHAEDDSVIPISLGKKLFKVASSVNRTLEFVEVSKVYGCDHFRLYIYPNLLIYVAKFLLKTETTRDENFQSLTIGN